MTIGLRISQGRLVAGLEMVVDLVSPVSDPPNVDTEVVWFLWSGADGEGMPLLYRYGGYLDEAPVSGAVVELGRLLDPQAGHSGGEGDALVNDSLASSHQPADDAVKFLGQKDDGEENQPLPECRGV